MCDVLLQLDDVHDCKVQRKRSAGESGAEQRDILGGKLSAWLRLVARWTSSYLSCFAYPMTTWGGLPRPVVRGAMPRSLILLLRCRLTYARHMCSPALGCRRWYCDLGWLTGAGRVHAEIAAWSCLLRMSTPPPHIQSDRMRAGCSAVASPASLWASTLGRFMGRQSHAHEAVSIATSPSPPARAMLRLAPWAVSTLQPARLHALTLLQARPDQTSQCYTQAKKAQIHVPRCPSPSAAQGRTDGTAHTHTHTHCHQHNTLM